MALGSIALASFSHASFGAKPLDPSAALEEFRLPAGYRIELVACEPQIVDPVAMSFDSRGRLWVVEMPDYPLLAEGATPGSRIRILIDKDEDGIYESASVFAEGLLFPTGLQLWGSGAFVTLAGEVAFFPDDDDDGRADHKETWYEGFATVNEQLRANHPTLAADGWIYVASGMRGGTIKNHRLPNAPAISINGRDFAFNPRTGECRAVSGNGQFGMTFDDAGRRFTCSNRNPLIEVMIEQRYLDRNPKLILPRVVQDAAAAGVDSRLYPRSRAITTSAQHSGQFTAACGVELYRCGELPGIAGQAFVCEPTANLVHREALAADGVAVRATPIDRNDEFLTAADEWFRPVNLAHGPDGALYVVDMYRAVIEHPEWMPPELRSRPDMRDGADRGRIYRIVADSAPAAEPKRLRTVDTDDLRELAALLEHPNSWQRETAARLLLELGGDETVAAIQPIARQSQSAAARHLAWSLLEALDAVSAADVADCFADPSPEVRALGLTFAETRLAEAPELADALLKLADDPAPRVRYQSVLSSLFLPAIDARKALTSVARRDSADPWACRAIALAARDQAAPLLAEMFAADVSAEVTPVLVRELIAAVVAYDRLPDVIAIVHQLDSAAARVLLLESHEALQQRGDSLTTLIAELAQQQPEARKAICRLFDEAVQTVADADLPADERIAAAELLELDARPATSERLLELLAEGEPAAVQIAAIRALRSQSATSVAETLIDIFPDQFPAARRATLDLLSARPEWRLNLLAAVADERIAAADVDPARQEQLMQDSDATVRDEAVRIFAAERKSREEVLQRYQVALQLTGDAQRGHAVYAANCASCHRIGGEGTAVGPDIGDASMKTSEQLLTDILDPNRAVDANFVNYAALTIDGVGHQGVISSESESGIVLLGADGKSISIPRDEIDSLTSGKSLMPEGLEQQITPQQMADLLAFLKTWRHAAELRATRPAESDKSAAFP
jgi:putative membrane-bound dehydrogenase-like protein